MSSETEEQCDDKNVYYSSGSSLSSGYTELRQRKGCCQKCKECMFGLILSVVAGALIIYLVTLLNSFIHQLTDKG